LYSSAKNDKFKRFNLTDADNETHDIEIIYPFDNYCADKYRTLTINSIITETPTIY